MAAGSDDYYESSNNIDIVAGTSSYALPSDFLKLIGMDVKRSNGEYFSMHRYSKAERNTYSYYRIAAVSREWTQYRIRGNNVVLIPEPNWTETAGVRMLYVPVPDDLSDDSDTLDGVAGWEDWIVYKCLIKFIGGKEEGDPSVWLQLINQLDQRIEDMLMRDRANSDKIRNIEEEESERLWPRFGSPS